MATSYIPRADPEFAAFADQYYLAVESWWKAHGLDMADLAKLKAALDEWDSLYPAHIALQAAAEGGRQAKDAARRTLERHIRPIANFIQTFPKTTDSDRAAIGITVRQPTGGASPAPTGRPLVRVESGTRLRHTIRFTDEATPTRRARPRNTLGAEVRLALVPAGAPAPTDPESLRFLTLATDGAATTSFPSTAGGQTAVYMLRWVGTGGATGPWSEICSATVAA